MKYMLLIYHEEQTWDQRTEAERQQIYGEYRGLTVCCRSAEAT